MISQHALAELLKAHSFPSFRAKQILHAVYQEGKNQFSEMKNLPKNLQEFLEKNLSAGASEANVPLRRDAVPRRGRPRQLIRPKGETIFCFSVQREVSSANGDTTKTLFKLSDGALMEGVLMRFRDGRNSVCVSSQVGCGLRCAFCATGTMGFKRNLTAEEISDQVLYFDQLLKKKNTRVDHVIFMGMGEPMLNYDAVLESIRTMNDKQCLGIAARHITISTSGVIPGIKKLTDEKLQVNLAVSLHAPNQALRESIMPIAKPYKIEMLIDVLNAYVEKTHRRISYEYVMLKGVNDAPELAEEFAKLIRGQRCHVNLIPYNQTYLGFSNAGKSRIDRFAEIIDSYKIPVTVRVSLGQDISAACGQLAVKEKN